MATDKDVLRWCGLMGHPFAVLCDDVKDGRRSCAEVNTKEQALKYAGEEKNGTAYQRTAKGWKAIKAKPALPVGSSK